MEYLTIQETEKKWGLSARMINVYCAEGRIKGAVKKGNMWLVPASAMRPADGRTKAVRKDKQHE